jgi:hypothetical protein
VRLLSFLPADDKLKGQALAARWIRIGATRSPQSAFLALALAELSSSHSTALDAFCLDTGRAGRTLRQIVSGGKWLVERDPHIAVAALCIAFGVDTVRAWTENGGDPVGREIVRSVFGVREDRREGEQLAKFMIAAVKVLKQVKQSAGGERGRPRASAVALDSGKE